MSLATEEEKKKGGKSKSGGLTVVVQEALKDILEMPSIEEVPDLFIDWGDTEKFHVKTAKGECAA